MRAILFLPFLIWSPVMAQSKSPIILETTFGETRVELLKVEDRPNGHYEKWRRKTLITFGFFPANTPNRIYQTKPLARTNVTLRFQTSEKSANLFTGFADLKAELNAIVPSDPKPKKWDKWQTTSKTEVTLPGIQQPAFSKAGWICYAWLYRDFEMEGVQVGDKTIYKAEISTEIQGPKSVALDFGRTFDPNNGEILLP